MSVIWKRAIGICAVILMLILHSSSLVGMFVNAADQIPQQASLSQGVQNIVKRAKQMTQIKWTPLEDITGWGGGVTYKARTTYIGLPYGQPVYASYVPWSTSLEGFAQAVNDSGSKMYTDYSTYGKRAPYYSVDCSAFVSWAWGMDSRHTTSTIPNKSVKISSNSYAAAQVGDCLCLAGSHVVLITDISYDSSGNINGVEISESTTNKATFYCCQTTRYGVNGSYTLDDLVGKYFGSGYILYRNPARDNVTYTHSCAVPLEGDSCSKCNLGNDITHKVRAQVLAVENVTIYDAPSGNGTAIGTAYAGTTIEVVGFLEDDGGLVWYKTMDSDWIKAAQTEFDCYLKTASIVGRSFPDSNLTVGAVFPLKGTISAENPIASVTATISNVGNLQQQFTVKLDGVFSYVLDGSKLDNEMRFDNLSDGSYTFQLRVTEEGFCPAGGSVQMESEFQSTFKVGTGTVECSHAYNSIRCEEPTCETDGVMRYYCLLCNESYDEKILSLGHAYVAVSIPPDCRNNGFTQFTCSRCGAVYQEDAEAALGHQYANGTCTLCGEVDPSLIKGDLTRDGAITSADAVMLARYLADLTTLDAAQLLAADINGDGFVTAADGVMLARYLAELTG